MNEQSVGGAGVAEVEREQRSALSELKGRLRQLRGERRLSMVALELKAELGHTTVSRALNGSSLPSETTVIALAQALRADAAPLLGLLREAASAGEGRAASRGDRGRGTDSDVDARVVPPRLAELLRASAGCLVGSQAFVRSCEQSGDGGNRRDALRQRIHQLLCLAVAAADPDALGSLSARDAVVLLALTSQVASQERMGAAELAVLVARDKMVRSAYIRFVERLKTTSPQAWAEQVGEWGLEPNVLALAALSTDMGEPELAAVAYFCERHAKLLTAATERTGVGPQAWTERPESFSGFRRITAAVASTLDEPGYRLAESIYEHLAGVKYVAGCRVLYVAVLLRAALQMSRLLEIDDDGTIVPARGSATSDRMLQSVRQEVADVRLESEDEAEALRLVCVPDDPRALERVRREVEELRDVIDQCTAALAQHYTAGRDAVLRMRHSRIRSSVDDPERYVHENALPFDPHLGKLALNVSGILPLLVRPLYGDHPEAGIRELLQNSLDAVWARRAIERGRSGDGTVVGRDIITITVTDGTAQSSELAPPSVPAPHGWQQWLEVRDTGVGMTSEVVREHFLTVGGSYDPVDNPTHGAPRNHVQRPRIGRFGVGVLAAFLLGPEVQVITRHMRADEDQALCFQMAEQAADAEITYCRAPVGTTIRVRLDAARADYLVEDPEAWDWFQYADPPVVRGHVRNKQFGVFESAIGSLMPDDSTDHWRRLSVPPYGEVQWAPAPEPYRSQIFVNGIRVASLHRNFDHNVMAPQEQLRQPVISIEDRGGSTELRLTRDGFVSYPTEVFSAVRRDALSDHIAWLVTVAQEGPHGRIRWESRIWEEEMYHSGQGDGVVSAVPYVVTDLGVVPLHAGFLRRAGITELNFLLSRGSTLRTWGEADDRPRGQLSVGLPALRAAVPGGPGTATGMFEVDMFGGFDFSTLAAGVSDTFIYASRLGTTALVQVVNVDRGEDYARLYPETLERSWQDALALRHQGPRAGRHRQSRGRSEISLESSEDWQVRAYLDTFGSGQETTKIGNGFGKIRAVGCYGVLHAWLEDQAQSEDEFTDLWRAYRLPPVLPFGMDLSTHLSPLSGDLRVRTDRVTAETGRSGIGEGSTG